MYHEAMPVSRQARRPKDLRENQKARTRAALVDAATELLREGGAPTVPEAAERARVSRATAYRYFPTQDALLTEIAGVGPAVAPVEDMLAGLDGIDVEERLTRLLDMLNPIMLADEARGRAALRVYLDTWLHSGGDAPLLREGRRVRWLDTVLEPERPRLSDAHYERLRAALALTMSIDAIVVMRDVCHIDDDGELLEVLRWAASVILRAGLSPPGHLPPARGSVTGLGDSRR
jgi:AcrR family transcriptional regulator